MAELAIAGGTPVRGDAFPSWPQVTEQDVEAVNDVIRSGHWHRISWGRAGQSKAQQFEKAFAAYQGANYGLAVTSGTAAVEVALRAVGIGPGDEVIMPAHSFMATASATLMGVVSRSSSMWTPAPTTSTRPRSRRPSPHGRAPSCRCTSGDCPATWNPSWASRRSMA